MALSALLLACCLWTCCSATILGQQSPPPFTESLTVQPLNVHSGLDSDDLYLAYFKFSGMNMFQTIIHCNHIVITQSGPADGQLGTKEFMEDRLKNTTKVSLSFTQVSQLITLQVQIDYIGTMAVR